VLTLPDRKGLEFVIADTAKTNLKANGQPQSRCEFSTAAFWMKSRRAVSRKNEREGEK
jgi:hypothetical protein